MPKRVASLLPWKMQQEARRWKAWLDLKRGRFLPSEPEYYQLPQFVRRGDWVLDIGANVGYYTMRFSELAGQEGRVFAFEPITATCEILSFMVRFSRHPNVTVINAAVSDKTELLRFSITNNRHGLPDYFTARATDDGTYAAFATTIDSLSLPQRVAFVKIDTEGAEKSVLRGMQALLERDHPVLVIEGDESLLPYLAPLGYRMQPRKEHSPNLLFLPPDFSGLD